MNEKEKMVRVPIEAEVLSLAVNVGSRVWKNYSYFLEKSENFLNSTKISTKFGEF